MVCSYELFLAVASLKQRSFGDIPLGDVTAALDANGLSDVAHVRFAHIDDDFELPPGSHASLLQFFVVLQKEMSERCARNAHALVTIVRHPVCARRDTPAPTVDE